MTEKRKPKPRAVTAASVVPHDLDAERAILGAIVINNNALDAVADIVRPGDFFRSAHRLIFEYSLKLASEHQAIDYLTLMNAAREAGTLEAVGGVMTITSLTEGVPTATNATHYARIVRDHSRRRETIGACTEAIQIAYDLTEELTGADGPLLSASEAVSGHRTRSRAVALVDGLQGLTQRIEARVEHKGAVTGVPTGFAEIDKITLGWQPGDLPIIGARTSIGKTSFVLNAAIHAATLGHAILIISLEMRRSQLEDRILSILSGVDITRIRSGHLGSLDYPKIAHALETMATLPIVIDDAAGRTAKDIIAGCRRVRRERGLAQVVVDYIQLVAGQNLRTTRNEQISDAVTSLKDAADELQCPVVVLSQLARKDATRNDPEPQLHDLRDSGALEQLADSVSFLHRGDHRSNDPTKFILAKQRNGPTGTFWLQFDRTTQVFTEIEEPAPPPPKASKPGRTRGDE